MEEQQHVVSRRKTHILAPSHHRLVSGRRLLAQASKVGFACAVSMCEGPVCYLKWKIRLQVNAMWMTCVSEIVCDMENNKGRSDQVGFHDKVDSSQKVAFP